MTTRRNDGAVFDRCRFSYMYSPQTGNVLEQHSAMPILSTTGLEFALRLMSSLKLERQQRL